jgi:hypothetical protein
MSGARSEPWTPERKLVAAMLREDTRVVARPDWYQLRWAPLAGSVCRVWAYAAPAKRPTRRVAVIVWRIIEETACGAHVGHTARRPRIVFAVLLLVLLEH